MSGRLTSQALAQERFRLTRRQALAANRLSVDVDHRVQSGSLSVDQPLPVGLVNAGTEETRGGESGVDDRGQCLRILGGHRRQDRVTERSEEHTSALQSLMRISYAVFCLKTTRNKNKTTARRNR